MAKRVLTIMEVSQKQAYIFSSNKLKDNVTNSAVIAWVTDVDFFEETAKEMFDREKNFVYSGGGHSILEFPGLEQAREFAKRITLRVHKDYPRLELFVKTVEYDEDKSPSKNIKQLTAELEKKKSERKSYFHQSSFGIEKVDSTSREPVSEGIESKKDVMPEKEQKIEKMLSPNEFRSADKFEDLGGTKGKSNFIAVVHIDGNSMGKRLERFNDTFQKADWDTYKAKIREFSDSIDKHFKESYMDMIQLVETNLKAGKLEELSLKQGYFPVRRIITAGDDVCFVTEGRIGVECAAAFLKALNKKVNPIDHLGYSACAGVAIIHQKYPFYRGYELSELLCSNAKKFGVSLKEDGSVSAIDWHIEYGEMKDTLDEVRMDYNTQDGNRLELRPYIVCASEDVYKNEKHRRYLYFKKLITNLQNKKYDYARGKIKELRTVLKQGMDSAEHFIKFYKIEGITLESYIDIFEEADIKRVGTGKGQEKRVFVETSDGKKRSILFDAIELSDTFLALSEGETE